MRDFHTNWFFVAVISCGAVGLWGTVLGLVKREPGRFFPWARNVAIAAMLVQIGAGLILWQRGFRPGDGFHVFYGLVIAFTFSFAYIYKAQLSRRPALGYGLLLLFVMGLGIRAWVNTG
jgi:hypothetical protein